MTARRTMSPTGQGPIRCYSPNSYAAMRAPGSSEYTDDRGTRHAALLIVELSNLPDAQNLVLSSVCPAFPFVI